MSAGGYILGFVLLALIVAPLVAGAVRVRGRLLPGWEGAPARVAEAVMALGALVVIAELLGTVGLFHEAALIPACVTAGAFAWRWGAAAGRGATVAPGAAASPAAAPPQSRPLTWVALAGSTLVAVAWLERTYHAVHNGMTDSDTLWYHVPYAARWVQEGSLTALHFTSYEPLTTFYPSTPSLLHAISMLAFGTELLSPYLNLGWLALALTAGWAIGRPFGAAPATLLASALVMGTPIIVGMQAGSAKDDAPGIALVLCAVALLVNSRRWDASGRHSDQKPPDAAGIGLAGLAAGLLIGTKLSMVAPALALFVAAVAAAPRAQRMRTGGLWAAMLLVGGGFWYLRNLGGTGNPVPWFEVNAGPLSLPSPELAPYTERYVTKSVADHLGESGFVGDYLTPSLEGAFGPAWWALLALALAGMIGALVSGNRLLRALGAAGLLMAVAYVLTPGGAGDSPDGIPHLVFWSMRYLAPALALGLVLLPLLPPVRPRQGVALGLVAVALIATQFAEGGFAIWAGRPPIAVLLAPVVAAAAVLAARALRGRGRAPVAAVAAAASLAVLAGGWKVQDIYFDNRYTDPASPLAMPYDWARTVEDARIGIVGFYLQSPLLGKDLSNHVQYVGHSGGDGEFRSVRSCAEWRAELAEGDYDYVVTAPFNFPWGATNDVYPREARWTETDPSARRIGRNRSVAIFELTGEPDPATCESDGFPARAGDEGEQETGPSRPSS